MTDDDDDEDEEDDENEFVREHPVAPPARKTPPMIDTSDDEDDDEDAPEAPAPRSATSYRPTDEQMHMMDLMKRIFESALNAGLSAEKPPQSSPPAEPPPEPVDLRKQLITLQQKIREAEIPVVIVIEGLSGSGKGVMLSKLIEGLDSRGDTKRTPSASPTAWSRPIPPCGATGRRCRKKGDIALFCSSWYGELNNASL